MSDRSERTGYRTGLDHVVAQVKAALTEAAKAKIEDRR